MRVKLSEITNYSKGDQINGDELIENGEYIYLNGGINPSGRWSSSNVSGDTVTISEGGNSSGYVNYISEPFWCGAHCYYLYDGPSNSKYLYYALKSQQDRLFAIRSGACMPNIKKSDLGNFELEFDSDEQKQNEIVKILSNVEQVISSRQKELELFDELIKARFVELFGKNKDTCEVGYYIKSLTAGKSLAGDAECVNKVLKTGAASFDYFDATQVKNLPLDYEPQAEHLVNPGDIIISRMNTAELTGAAAYVWDVQDNVYLPDRLWKANLTDECNPIFVWQMLIQPSTKEQIRRECSGTSGSMKNISKPGMLAIKVKKVPLELQNHFAEFVKQVDKSKVAVQKALEKDQLLFDSLMQEYFG